MMKKIVMVGCFLSMPIQAQEGVVHALAPLDVDTPPLNRVQARNLINPVPADKESIEIGRQLFVQHKCSSCHGDRAGEKTYMKAIPDLEDPATYRHGASEGEVFRSIRDGVGWGMPAFKEYINHEEQVWHLVNYIRSRWSEGFDVESE